MAAKKCTVCSIRAPKTGSKGTETSPHNDLCNYCFEESGWENTHSDYGHDAILAAIEAGTELTKRQQDEAEMMQDCWICHPERNLAKLPAKAASTGPKAQGTRRPQFNHKGHHHPQTPAARRACKDNFWAIVKASGTTDEAIISKAQAEWDAYLDGYGKPVSTEVAQAAPKGGWAGVAPLGPKGGTGASLKAAGAKAASINAKK